MPDAQSAAVWKRLGHNRLCDGRVPTYVAAERYGALEDHPEPDFRFVVKPVRPQPVTDAPRSWPSTRPRIAFVRRPRRYRCPRSPCLVYARPRLRPARPLLIYEIFLLGVTGRATCHIPSNPKSVQNGQRSSPISLQFGVKEILDRGQCSDSADYRTTAARARKLQADASTPRVKQYLDTMIAHCERLASTVEPGVSPDRSTTIGRSRGFMIGPRSSRSMSRSY